MNTTKIERIHKQILKIKNKKQFLHVTKKFFLDCTAPTTLKQNVAPLEWRARAQPTYNTATHACTKPVSYGAGITIGSGG